MFWWPPRPETAINPSFLGFYEKRGWVCQKKMNGTCSVIYIDGAGKVEFYTRRNEPHKAWRPLPEHLAYLSQFPNSMFVGELLHNKGPGVKNTFYMFDVLMSNGVEQIGQTLLERHALLCSLFADKPSWLWIAENATSGFKKIFDAGLNNDLEEGIVLKDPKSKLRSCLVQNSNQGWQVKCRKPTRNFTN